MITRQTYMKYYLATNHKNIRQMKVFVAKKYILKIKSMLNSNVFDSNRFYVIIQNMVVIQTEMVKN